MIAPEALHGAWRLLDFHVHYSDGRPSGLPYGPEADGRIIYAPGGQMSAVLTAGGRSGGQSLETSARATPEQKAQAFDTYLSYAGTWRLEGGEVVHTVDMALVAAAVGREQRRRAELEDGVLTLTYQRTPPSGVTRTFCLRWEREAGRAP